MIVNPALGLLGDAGAGGSQVLSQLGLHSKPLSQKKKIEQK
jgi:hypothetical protein